MNVKISIIIPAYNVAGYIEHCIDSILAQTFEEYEVIVVDDGSTDATPEIIDTYAQKDSRIHVIHKKNEGVSIARNTGIDLAAGEYFLFFDGDDFSENYTLEELYQTITEKEADTIIYGYHRYENGQVKETCYPIFEQGFYTGDSIVRELLSRFIGISYDRVNGWLHHEEKALYVENPALWRTMVSASIIKENHLRFHPKLKVGEDTIFISQYLSYAKKCYVLQKCYYYLVTRESSTIYQYELNPEAKLQGKINLLDARTELTEDIRERTGIDIHTYWGGTVVMSAIEIAFLMSGKNPKYGMGQRYRLFCSYLDLPGTKKKIREFRLQKAPSIKLIPFLLLKWGWRMPLFLATTMLKLVHYEFQR